MKRTLEQLRAAYPDGKRAGEWFKLAACPVSSCKKQPVKCSVHIEPDESIGGASCFHEKGKHNGEATHIVWARIDGNEPQRDQTAAPAKIQQAKPLLTTVARGWPKRWSVLTETTYTTITSKRPGSYMPSLETLRRYGFREETKKDQTILFGYPISLNGVLESVKYGNANRPNGKWEWKQMVPPPPHTAPSDVLFGVDQIFDPLASATAFAIPAIFICEGQWDALSLTELGYCAVATGTAGQSRIQQDIIDKLCIVRKIFLVPDRDANKAGEHMEELAALFPSNKVFIVDLPDGYKDVCELAAALKEEPPKVTEITDADGMKRTKYERVGGLHLERLCKAARTRSAEPVAVPHLPLISLTDLGNAERLALRYSDRFAYTAATGWLAYEHGTWKRDETRGVVRAMHDTVRLIDRENPGKDFEAWARKSEASAKIKAALEQASALRVFARNYADFDRRPDLLNVANGVINLKTFAFLPHDPTFLLTKQSPINYDPKATCPRWERFVLDIMGNKPHMVEYLQRCCGYTLTADTSGQCFFMPWGMGGTGKTQLLLALAGITGTYCRHADAEMFMVKRGDAGQPFDMAGLEGARLLMAVETEEGKKLALAKLKRMTGQDPIPACYKFQTQYEFMPQWKVWLATNDAPTTRSDDDAFWDRAKPIPFETKFRNTEKEIKNLAAILLRDEGSGILNWMLTGLKQFQEIGLSHPADVAQKADEWRDRDDWLARFIEDLGPEQTDDKQKFVTKHALWLAFSHWSEQTKQANGVGEKGFTQAMRRKGYDDGKGKPIKRAGKTVRVWLNLCIPSEPGSFPEGMDNMP